jgi:hypothetical protein
MKKINPEIKKNGGIDIITTNDKNKYKHIRLYI